MAGYDVNDPPPVPAAIAMFVEKNQLIFRAVEGHALYIYDKDPVGKSTCVDRCMLKWLPVKAPLNATAIGPWTPIERPDKSKQWSFKGKALYVYADDEPGDTEGDGIDGAWHIFTPTP